MVSAKQSFKIITCALIVLLVINPVCTIAAGAIDTGVTFNNVAIPVATPDMGPVATDRQRPGNEERAPEGMTYQYGNHLLDYYFDKLKEKGPSWLEGVELPFGFDQDGKLQYHSSWGKTGLNFGNNLINDYLEKGKEKGPPWLKTTDLQLRFDENVKPIYSVETLQPVKQGTDTMPRWFVQGRYASESDQNATANLGLISRKVAADQTSIIGFNTFFDHNFQYDLSRIGLGMEYFDKRAEFRFNWYHPLSGDRLTGVSYQSDGILSSYIRAVEGFDFEGGTSFINAPWLKFYLGGYYYDNQYRDDEKGYKIRSALQLTPRLNIELGYQASNLNHDFYGTVSYQLAAHSGSSLWGGNREKQTNVDDIQEKLWRKVERDNAIKTEIFTKFTPYTGNIQVTVTNSNNSTALVGATAQAYHNGKAVGAFAVTDANGQALISGLAIGSYTVKVIYGSYDRTSSPVIITKDQTTPVSVSLAVDGGNVAIQVVNSQSQPVDGTQITATMRRAGTLSVKSADAGNVAFNVTLPTDINGMAVFTNLPFGVYTFAVSNGALHIQSQSYPIEKTDLQNITILLPDSGGVINVTVKDGSDTALNGATVNLLLDDATITADKSDADGMVVFGGIAAGTYSLNASSDNYNTVTKDVTVTDGATTSSTITLTRDTGNATVTLIYSDGQTNAAPTFTLDGKTTITGAAGTPTADGKIAYTFSNLTTGDHQIAAAVTGYTSSGVSAVTVEKGTTKAGTDIHLTRDTGGATMTVTANHQPLAGTLVRIEGTLQSANTDENGVASFSKIPTGNYQFTALKESYAVKSATDVTVKNGATTTIAIDLTRQIGNAAITVTGNGLPVSNATVEVLVDGESQSATTDGSGVAAFTGLPAGYYDFTARKDGFTDNTVTSVGITNDGNTAATIPLTRQTGGASITVSDGANPLVDAAVKVTVNGTVQAVNTDSAGVASFTGLPTDSYEFEAAKDEYIGNTVSNVSVKNNEVAEAKIALIRKTGSATVTVTDGANPLEGVAVTVTVDGAVQTAITDASGIAAFTSLPTGKNTFTAEIAGYGIGVKDVNIDWQGNATAVISLTRQTGSARIEVYYTNKQAFEDIRNGVAEVVVNGTLRSANVTGGIASFTDLPVGNYQFSVKALGYTTNTFALEIKDSQTATVKTYMDCELVTVDFGTADITVTDNQGQPLKGVVVAEPGGVKIITDNSGVASFPALAETPSSSFTASMAGYRSKTITGVEITIAKKATATIVLTKSGDAAITVTDSNKNPLAGVTVGVKSGAATVSAATDTNGMAKFYDLPVGICSITAEKETYITATGQMYIVLDKTVNPALTLSKQTGRAQITITVSDNQAITPGFTLDGAAYTAYTKNGNVYTFSNLAVGNHRIDAAANNYTSSGAVNVGITNGGATEQTITLNRNMGKATVTITNNNWMSLTPEFTVDGAAMTPDVVNGALNTFILPTGIHTITATAAGCSVQTPAVIPVTTGTDTMADITFVQNVNISVCATGQDGGLIMDATITVTVNGAKFSTTTVRDGYARFANIPLNTPLQFEVKSPTCETTTATQTVTKADQSIALEGKRIVARCWLGFVRKISDGWTYVRYEDVYDTKVTVYLIERFGNSEYRDITDLYQKPYNEGAAIAEIYLYLGETYGIKIEHPNYPTTTCYIRFTGTEPKSYAGAYCAQFILNEPSQDFVPPF